MLSSLITAIAPIVVALIGLIPIIISNRRKTQESLEQTNKDIKESMSKIQTTLDNHIKENEDSEARNRRYRILRFNDEICEGRSHSESHFEDILEDIDFYELYSANHPEFKNSRGGAAMKHIKETYEKLKAKGEFLLQNKGDEIK